MGTGRGSIADVLPAHASRVSAVGEGRWRQAQPLGCPLHGLPPGWRPRRRADKGDDGLTFGRLCGLWRGHRLRHCSVLIMPAPGGEGARFDDRSGQPMMRWVGVLIFRVMIAVAASAGPAYAQTGYDRAGGDYTNFVVRSGDPAACALRCE